MDIQQVLNDHKEWLLNPAKGKRAYLSGADLSGADLSGADLSRAYLSRAYLSGANLSGADLSNTIIFAFYLGRDFGYAFNGLVKIGCIELKLNDWIKQYKDIGKQNNYSLKEITRYGNMLKFIKSNKLGKS